MCALKDKQGNITSNFDDIVKAAEFYTDLYSTESKQASFIRSSDEEDEEVPSITIYEVKMALQAMTRGKAAGEDGITVELIRDGGDTPLEKLAAFIRNASRLQVYQRTGRIPRLYRSIRRETLKN